MDQLDASSPPNIPETGSGFEVYAENLGLTPKELEELLADNDVLILGAGKNKLAGDIHLRSLDLNYPVRARITAVDIRYGDPHHDENIKSPTYSLAPPPDAKVIALPATDPVIAHIRKQVDQTRQPGNWSRLDDALGSKRFKVIVGNYAFSYWSDLGVDIHYQPNTPPQTTLNFPKETQATFRQIIEHLTPQGTFIGNTKMLFEEWTANPHLETEMRQFFADLGCDLTIRKGTQVKAHSYEFVVFQVTRK